MTEYGFAQHTPVPDDIWVLPDVSGYGNVYDLHQALVRDSTGELKSLVAEFSQISDSNGLDTLLGNLLFKWTGSDGIDPHSRGENIDARKLAVVESFTGEAFVGVDGPNPTYEAAVLLNDSYRFIFEYVHAALMAQTHLADLYGQVILTREDESSPITADMSPVISALQATLTSDPERGKELLGEFARSLRGAGAGRVHCLPCREMFIQMDPELAWVIDTGGLPVYDQLGEGLSPWSRHMLGTDNADAVKGSLTEGDGFINGFNGEDVIYGTDRNEHLINENGDALLVAGGGKDVIWGGAGNDILDGGAGTDYLSGEAGNDTYIFRRGSDQDTIIENDVTDGNMDTIWLGSFLTPDEIAVRRAGNDLVVRIIGADDKMTVRSFFDTTSTAFESIEYISFADGTIWDVEDIRSRWNQPTTEWDYLTGSPDDDTIDGLGGDDIILGEGSNDTLIGDAGNDTLIGGTGEDVLTGGAGNDYSEGGTGSDTYFFTRGDGQDVIKDAQASDGSVDTISFTDIAASEVVLTRAGADLRISVVGGTDSVTIKDCFTADDMQCPVERLNFSDGTIWEAAEIRQAVLTGTPGADSIVGFSSGDTIQGFDGNDTLEGRGGSDTILAAEGDDTLLGGSGNDVLAGVTSEVRCMTQRITNGVSLRKKAGAIVEGVECCGKTNRGLSLIREAGIGSRPSTIERRMSPKTA